MTSNQNKKGFTIIETMIAVLLLTTAIVGPLSIASRSLTVALVAKDQITAFYLAQDAVEFVRYARDTNRLSGTDWIAGAINLTDCIGTVGCKVDSVGAAAPTACSQSDCTTEPLYYDESSRKFTYTEGTNRRTPFVRAVYLTYTPGTAEAVLTVRVTWTDVAGVTHAPVIVQENLFNWQ